MKLCTRGLPICGVICCCLPRVPEVYSFPGSPAHARKPTRCPCFKTTMLAKYLLQIQVQVGLLGTLLSLSSSMNVSNKSSLLLLAARNGLVSGKPFSLQSQQLKFRGFQEELRLISCSSSPWDTQAPLRPSPALSFFEIQYRVLNPFWEHPWHVSQP